jgi:hypothetical protein
MGATVEQAGTGGLAVWAVWGAAAGAGARGGRAEGAVRVWPLRIQ